MLEMAKNPKTPPVMLRQLFEEHKSLEMWRALAANPAVPYDVLEELAEVPDVTVRSSIIERSLSLSLKQATWLRSLVGAAELRDEEFLEESNKVIQRIQQLGERE